MTWTVTDWAVTHNYGSLTLWHEMWAAVRERSLASGLAFTLTEPTLGCNIGSLSFIRAWQEQIEDLLAYYAVSHNTTTGAYLGAGYYDGAASIPTYTLATVFAAAFPGEGRTNWRGYTTAPSKNGSDLGSKQGVGGIIGPWLFEDLQKVLNVMVWTLIRYTMGPSGLATSMTTESKVAVGASWSIPDGGPDVTPSWALAVSRAETAYAAAEVTTLVEFAWAYSVGTKQVWSDPVYNTYLYRNRSKAKVSGISTAFAHAMDFYTYSNATGSGILPFDANHDPVIADKWSLFDTAAPTTDADVESGWLGSLDLPHWCAEPTEVGVTTYLGWIQSDWIAVIRWNVVGGFSFC
jgi:hypothetical protein